jgi:hypothetical protein
VISEASDIDGIMPGDFATTEVTPPALAAAAPPAAGR